MLAFLQPDVFADTLNRAILSPPRRRPTGGGHLARKL
jgi:hypothetical protein